MAKGTVGAGESSESDDLSLHLWFSDSDDPETTLPVLTAFVRAHPSRPDGLLALALAFVRAGNVDSAKQAIRRARFLAPEIADLLRSDAAPDAATLTAALDRLVGAAAAHSVPVEPMQTPVVVREETVPHGAPAVQPLSTRPSSQFESTSAEARNELLKVEGESDAIPPTSDFGRTPGQIALHTEDRLQQGALFEPQNSPPLEVAIGLPDGWTLSRFSLELWVRRFAFWALPFMVCNLMAALLLTWVGRASLAQALLWLVALAAGAHFSLRGIAREWSPEAIACEGAGVQRSVVLLAPLSFFLIGGIASALLATRVPVRGEELLALGMLVSLPLLALGAPAVMLWVTCRGGLREGLHLVKRSLPRRVWTYLAVVVLGGSLGGGLLLTLGWGFLSTLGVIDPLWIRLLQAVGIGLAESFLVVLIATCGLDALESHIRLSLPQGEADVG